MQIDLTVLNLKDVFVPFASAFAGAYFAYKFNVCSENKKCAEEQFKQFNILLNQVNVAWMALLNYKIVYLSKVENMINENPHEAVKETIYPPNVLFKANIENNIFLAKYNFQLLSLLSEIEKQTFLTQETIQLCQNHFMDNKNLGVLRVDIVALGIETFNLTKHYVDKSLAYLLLLRKSLFKCKDLYFRYLYLDNRDILMNSAFDSFVPDVNSFNEVVGCSTIIENSWVKPLNIFDCVKLFKDKIIFNLMSFCKFMGLKK